MTDIRDQSLNIGDRVYYLEFSSGSLHKYDAEIIGFTPSNVRITIERHWANQKLTPPKYIVKK